MNKLSFGFAFLAFLSLPTVLVAQKPVADSLVKLLISYPTKPDTHYVLTQCRVASAQLAFDVRLTDSTARLARQTARQIGFPQGEVAALNMMGVSAQRQDHYAEAVTYYLPAIQLAKTVHDTLRWARTLNNLGLAYFYGKNYPQALRSFEQATHLQRDPNEQAGLFNNIGLVFKNQEKFDSALAYFHRALPMFIAQKAPRGMASAYSNIGQIHLNRGEFRTAELFYRQALDVDQQSGNLNGEAISTTNVGVALARQKHYAEAVTYLTAGFKQSGQQHNLSNQHYAAETLYQLYEQQGKIEQAYSWHQQYHRLQDTLNRAEQQEKLAEIHSRYEHDQRLQQAEQALIVEQQQRRIWIGGLLGLIALVAVLIYAYWQSIRRRQVEKQLQAGEIARLQAEQVLQNRRETELQASIEDRERTLASQSMNLLQKNELMEKVSGQLQEAVGGPNASERLKPLLRLLQNSTQTDEHWETFKRHFESVHAGFFQRLLAQQPRLTAFDLRYCAYLRMNLTSKEIAALLNTSLRSVETQRYRLRQKLALPTEQDLVVWMMQL